MSEISHPKITAIYHELIELIGQDLAMAVIRICLEYDYEVRDRLAAIIMPDSSEDEGVDHTDD